MVQTGTVVVRAQSPDSPFWALRERLYMLVRKDRRDGDRKRDGEVVGVPCDEWEPETDAVALRDHYADLLIRAYQEGDKTALRPLIDRLLEILPGPT